MYILVKGRNTITSELGTEWRPLDQNQYQMMDAGAHLYVVFPFHFILSQVQAHWFSISVSIFLSSRPLGFGRKGPPHD